MQNGTSRFCGAANNAAPPELYVINLMKIPFSIICQLFLISIICISANANEIEKEFVAAGLIDVSII
ncbi:MAG: hypothetical protein V2B20_02895, partial [Pseudomonadota bacterium]